MGIVLKGTLVCAAVAAAIYYGGLQIYDPILTDRIGGLAFALAVLGAGTMAVAWPSGGWGAGE